MQTFRAGQSLRIKDVRMGSHLWFVLTEPDPETGKVVIVMLVTERPHTDRTVQLTASDHPFIRHTSAVDYGTARYAPVSRLEEAVASNQAALDKEMGDVLLWKVRRGLIASSHTPHDVVDYCRPLFLSGIGF